MSNLKHVEIITGGPGTAKVVVDGEDISSKLSEFTLSLKAGGQPKLIVTYVVDRLTVDSAQTELGLSKDKK